MDTDEVTSVILLAAAAWFTLAAFATILAMMQALWGLPQQEILILKAVFTIPRDNALAELWIGVIFGLYGLLEAPRQNEEIRDALYLVFPVIAVVGTALALLFT